MKCIGIDVGSTTIKGAVLDLDQRAIAHPVVKAFPTSIAGLPSAWVEVDPRSICNAALQVLTALAKVAPDADRVYWSGQMGGLMLVDDAGRPISNYISWRDQRAVAGNPTSLDQIRNRWSDQIFTELGNELQVGSTTTLLYWLAQAGSLPTNAIPVSVADFVIGNLCGTSPRTHVTHAIGMLDLNKSDWHGEALERLGLGQLRLPPLSHDQSCVGEFTLLGRKLRMFGSYGDQQCALRGAGLQRDELSLNISTGSQVSRRVSRFAPGPYQSRMYFFGDWLNTMTHLPAGRSLNVLVDLLTELARAEGLNLTKTWETIIRSASDVESTNLEVDLAFFAGAMGVSGAINQITTENLTVGHLFHAAFRTMADNYRKCAARLCPDEAWTAVRLSGGMTQSIPLLRRFIEDRFESPIRESVGEETLFGLLDIALEEK